MPIESNPVRMNGQPARRLASFLAMLLVVSAAHAAPPSFTQPVLFNSPKADVIVSRLQVFPPDNPWNADISAWPVHPNSANIIRSIGDDKSLRANYDMNYILVPTNQPRVAVKIVGYPAESDPGPYPVPDNVPIEGWPLYHRGASLREVQRNDEKWSGDRHAIVVDPVNLLLYEFFQLKRAATGWQATQASIFDLKTNQLRPAGWTSADAAGLPIFPAVVRYDELQRGEIRHALRVTVRRTRRAYVAPARHFASSLTAENLPRMGERLRLRADIDLRRFSRETQVILRALQTHGMLVADNGIDWAISIAPDPRIPELHRELRRITGRDFEVVVAP